MSNNRINFRNEGAIIRDAAEDLRTAVTALLTGPIYHLVPAEQERHWPQIAFAKRIIDRIDRETKVARGLTW